MLNENNLELDRPSHSTLHITAEHVWRPHIKIHVYKEIIYLQLNSSEAVQKYTMWMRTDYLHLREQGQEISTLYIFAGNWTQIARCWRRILQGSVMLSTLVWRSELFRPWCNGCVWLNFSDTSILAVLVRDAKNNSETITACFQVHTAHRDYTRCVASATSKSTQRPHQKYVTEVHVYNKEYGQHTHQIESLTRTMHQRRNLLGPHSIPIDAETHLILVENNTLEMQGHRCAHTDHINDFIVFFPVNLHTVDAFESVTDKHLPVFYLYVNNDVGQCLLQRHYIQTFACEQNNTVPYTQWRGRWHN